MGVISFKVIYSSVFVHFHYKLFKMCSFSCAGGSVNSNVYFVSGSGLRASKTFLERFKKGYRLP